MGSGVMDGDVIGIADIISIGLDVADDVGRVGTGVTDAGVSAVIAATAALGRRSGVGNAHMSRVSTSVRGITAAGTTTSCIVVDTGISRPSLLVSVVVKVDIVVVTNPIDCA